MKKQLLALSLVLATGLYADDMDDYDSTTMEAKKSQGMNSCDTGTSDPHAPQCTSSCSCNPCKCNPCECEPCVPKTKKCIDCTCYNPPFYDLQCDCGFFLDAEFLYWYARETNLSYALRFEGVAKNPANATSDVVFSPVNYQNMTTKWSPGVRAGIGWNSGCDGWDYFLHWTYLPNRKSNRFSVDRDYSLTNAEIFLPAVGEQALLSQWVNPAVFPQTTTDDIALVTFDEAKARWKLDLNSIDLELGRKFWTSECFNIRPYVGIRGAWDRVKYRTILTRTDPTPGSFSVLTFEDQFKTRNWGVGMLAGLQPAFSLCQSFIIFGNVDAALIWGEFEVKKTENYQDPDGMTGFVINWVSDTSKNKFFQMTPILDVALGARWEETWCSGQYRSALDIAWEHHVWFDQNHRGKLVDYFFGPGVAMGERRGFGFRTFAEATGNLDFGGLVVRLKVDF